MQEHVQNVVEPIIQDQWVWLCKELNLEKHATLISDCDKTHVPLLALIVGQHEELVRVQSQKAEVSSQATSVDKPPCKIQDLHASVDDDVVEVSWPTGDNTMRNISNYCIECDGCAESHIIEFESKDLCHPDDQHCSARIHGLKPWQSYLLRIRAENSAGYGEWSEFVFVELNKSPPPKPSEVTIEVNEDPDTESRELLLKVNKPSHHGNVQEYQVTYHSEEDGHAIRYKEDVDKSYNSTFVLPKPFTKSSLRSAQVRFRNEFGWSEPTKTLDSLLSDTKPSKVQRLSYLSDTLTSDSVELVWEEPATNAGIVESYEVEWSTPRTAKSTDGCILPISQLCSDTEYHFRICPITVFGKRGEASETLSIKTLS